MKATSAWRCVKGVVPWETSKPKPSPRSNGLHRAHPLRLQLLAVVGCVLCGEACLYCRAGGATTSLAFLLAVAGEAACSLPGTAKNGKWDRVSGSRIQANLGTCFMREKERTFGAWRAEQNRNGKNQPGPAWMLSRVALQRQEPAKKKARQRRGNSLRLRPKGFGYVGSMARVVLYYFGFYVFSCVSFPS